MGELNYKRLGVSFGLTGTILYLGCMILMVLFGKSGTVEFFNNVLHGLDVGPIIKMKISFGFSVLGLIYTFIIGWCVGAGIAGFYNASSKYIK
ncbi:MAG: hypothetical protein ACI8SE_000644 [Bacteroidia bacterium]|jgi:hypothetical protein